MTLRRTCILLLSVGFGSILLIYCATSYHPLHNTLRHPPRFSSVFNHSGNVSKATSSSDCLTQNVSHFVSFHESVKDGRRLGNQLFNLAAVLFVAELSNRIPVIANNTHLPLEDVFQLNLKRVSNLCPCHTIGEAKHLSYDMTTEKLNLNDPKMCNQTILVMGFRQSWKYTLATERRLRRHLVFRNEIQRFAESFLQDNIPRGWKRAGFVRVGIHIRRGDNLVSKFQNFGYTIPNETYFFKAMKHFTDRYNRVQFIVASDDIKWVRQHIMKNNTSPEAENITIGYNNTAGQDLAILSMCDHTIMSTGTYGWWAAWLAKGTTTYYSDWPRPGSPLAGQFTQKDFFPPFWIPLTSY